MLTMTPTKKQEKRATPKQVFEPQWIHAQITDEDLWLKFEQMAKAHQGGKSAFIRWLIDREWARRATGPLTQPRDIAPDAEERQDNGTVHWIGKKSEGDEGKAKK